MSLIPIHVSLLLARAAASAFSLAEWMDARSPPRDWQSARASAKDAGPAWYVKVGEEAGGGGGAEPVKEMQTGVCPGAEPGFVFALN